MSIPIWVCDPTGNNNPYLKIVHASILLGNRENDQNGNSAALFYSLDGTTWLPTNNAVSGFNGLNSLRQMTYGNGQWMCCFSYIYGFDQFNSPLEKEVAIQSTDGINWTIVLQADPTLSSTIQINFSGNSFTLTNGAHAVSVASPFAPNTYSGGDFISHGVGPMANPGSAASAPNVLQNSLPNGYTAIRYGFDGNSFGQFKEIALTRDPITNTVVNSGSGWPAANWTVVFDQDPSGVFPTVISPLYGQPGANEIVSS